MKTKAFATLLLGAFLLKASLSVFAAADLPALVASATKWESGQSMEVLAQIEQCIRESAGNAARCAELESALLPMLGGEASFEARRFACQQLAIIGSDASVPALTKLLANDENIGLACIAFGNRPSAKADEAMRAALATKEGQGRLQIISALGNRRDALAVEPLAKLARESDAALAETAIRALGKIATASACSAIATLRAGANPALQQALAEAALRCAGELAKSGDRKGAAAVYEPLIVPTQPEYVRRGAFAGLLRCDGDGGEQRILQALESSDDVLKPVAIGAVRELPSKAASATFGKELPKLPAEQQVWLIGSLAVRNDTAARDAIASVLLAWPEVSVRQAAAQALGRMGDARAVKPLAQSLRNAKSEGEVNTLVAALASLPANAKTAKALLGELKTSEGQARAGLVSALSPYRSPEVLDALLEETENADPAVAKAAYRILARAASWATLPRLMAKFVFIREANRRADAEAFLEQAVASVEKPEDRSGAVCAWLPRVTDLETRLALVRLLPACGDDRAFRACKDAWGDREARVREAAVAALADWPNDSAWETLAYICRNAESAAQHDAALRGLARLLGEMAEVGDRQTARAQELLDAARGDAELKLVLGTLGGLRNAGVLEMVLPLLGKPAIRAEAEVAVKKIAEAVKAAHPDVANRALERLRLN